MNTFDYISAGLGLAGGLFGGGGPSTRNMENVLGLMIDDHARSVKVFDDPRNTTEAIEQELERLYTDKAQKLAMTNLRNFEAMTGRSTSEGGFDSTRRMQEAGISFDASMALADALAPFIQNRGLYDAQRAQMSRIDPNAASLAAQLDSAVTSGQRDTLGNLMTVTGAIGRSIKDGGTKTDGLDNIAEEAKVNTATNTREIAARRGNPVSYNQETRAREGYSSPWDHLLG